MITANSVTLDEMKSIVNEIIGNSAEEAKQYFHQCVSFSTILRVGSIDGEVACIWGLIPPTLTHNQAYLWLYTTDALEGNEFSFVRSSQLELSKLLETYEVIVGHTEITNRRGMRWIRWLGGVYGPPQGIVAPFMIRRKMQ